MKRKRKKNRVKIDLMKLGEIIDHHEGEGPNEE